MWGPLAQSVEHQVPGSSLVRADCVLSLGKTMLKQLKSEILRLYMALNLEAEYQAYRNKDTCMRLKGWTDKQETDEETRSYKLETRN